MSYPLLQLLARDSSYTYNSAQAFTVTKLNGGSSRIQPNILNGWAECNVTVMFKNRAERDYFNQVFYYQETKEFTLPFKMHLLSDGEVREVLCNALSAPKHSGFKGKLRSQVSFTVEFKPYIDSDKAKQITDGLALGLSFNEIDEVLYGN